MLTKQVAALRDRVANSGSGIRSGTDQFQWISVPVPRKRHDFSLEMHWILDENILFKRKIEVRAKSEHDCVGNSITVYHKNAFTVCFVVFDQKTHFTLENSFFHCEIFPVLISVKSSDYNQYFQ